MSRYLLLGAIIVACLITGCGGGGGGFPGAEWDVGTKHLSFTGAGAAWDPDGDTLSIAFLQTASGFPMITVLIEDISTATVGNSIDASVTVMVNSSETYSDDSPASVVFTKLSLKDGGSLSASISGSVERLESPYNVVGIASTWSSIPILGI